MSQEVIFAGENCKKQKDLYWKSAGSNSMNCHQFSPRNPEKIQGDWEKLELRVSYNSSELSPTYYSDAKLMIHFLNPSSALSFENNRMTTYLHPGNSYSFGLELFTYIDNSGSSECIEQGEKDVLDLFEGYSFFGCLEECKAKAELEACGCAAFFSLLNTKTTAEEREQFRLCSVVDYFFCGPTLDDMRGQYSWFFFADF